MMQATRSVDSSHGSGWLRLTLRANTQYHCRRALRAHHLGTVKRVCIFVHISKPACAIRLVQEPFDLHSLFFMIKCMHMANIFQQHFCFEPDLLHWACFKFPSYSFLPLVGCSRFFTVLLLDLYNSSCIPQVHSVYTRTAQRLACGTIASDLRNLVVGEQWKLIPPLFSAANLPSPLWWVGVVLGQIPSPHIARSRPGHAFFPLNSWVGAGPCHLPPAWLDCGWVLPPLPHFLLPPWGQVGAGLSPLPRKLLDQGLAASHPPPCCQMAPHCTCPRYWSGTAGQIQLTDGPGITHPVHQAKRLSTTCIHHGRGWLI